VAKIKDSSFNFGQGQNTALRPYMLPDGFTGKLINLTTKNDKLSLRDKFIETPITIIDDEKIDNTTYADLFILGKYQGDCGYFYDDNYYLLIVISGFCYQLDFRDNTAIVLNKRDRLNQYKNRLNVVNFSKYVQIFDYPDRPLVIERGNISRGSDYDFGTPAAVNGVFNFNRGFVHNPANEWLASDPVGGSSEFAPLTYLESSNPQSEFFGAFDLGFKNRNTNITFMGTLPTNDTGIGALLISNGESIFSYAVNEPRELWRQGVFGGEITSNLGIAGARTAVNYKRDMFILTREGFLSTIKLASSNERNTLTNRTISGRSQNWLDTVNKELLPYAVLETFDQRLFITAKPYRTTALDSYGNRVEDFAHAGLLVFEFQTKQGEEDERPVDAGFWTGIYPMSMRQIGSDFYIISKDPNSRNKIYRLDANAFYDRLNNKDKQVAFRIYTRGYAFENIDSMKDLYRHSYELSFSGDLKIDYALLRNETEEPIPMVCKTEIKRKEDCENYGTERYFQDFSPGVEFPKKHNFNKFFRVLQLILTGSARTFNLFRIKVEANRTPDDNLKSTDINCGIIEKDCNFIHDLNVYSLAEREDYIK